MFLKNALAFLLLLVIAAAGFFLPGLLSQVYDQDLEQGVVNLSVDPVQMEAAELSLPQRLRIHAAGSSFYAYDSNVDLEYTEDSIVFHAIAELEVFCQAFGLYGDFSSMSVNSCIPLLYIDPAIAPSRGVVIWDLTFVLPEVSYISLEIDETSGKIISLDYSFDYFAGESALYFDMDDPYAILDILAAYLCDYLEMEYWEYQDLESTSDGEVYIQYCTFVQGDLHIPYMFHLSSTGLNITPLYDAYY